MKKITMGRWGRGNCLDWALWEGVTKACVVKGWPLCIPNQHAIRQRSELNSFISHSGNVVSCQTPRCDLLIFYFSGIRSLFAFLFILFTLLPFTLIVSFIHYLQNLGSDTRAPLLAPPFSLKKKTILDERTDLRTRSTRTGKTPG